MRPAFASIGGGESSHVDEFVLSFEVGAVKPNPEIFETALSRLGVPAADALMVGDSDEADGGAVAVGARFCLVDPLPTDQRPDGLTKSAGRTRRHWRSNSGHARERTPPRWLKPINKVLHARCCSRGVSFRRRAAAGADGAGPQVGQAPLDADHPDGRSTAKRYAVDGLPRRGLGSKRPRRRRGDAGLRDGTPNASGWWSSRRKRRVPCCGCSRYRCLTGVGFLKNSGLVNDGTPDELEGLAGRLPVFRIDPIT